MKTRALSGSSCDSGGGLRLSCGCRNPSDATCGSSSMLLSNFEICVVVSISWPGVGPEGKSVSGFYAAMSKQSSKTPISTSWSAAEAPCQPQSSSSTIIGSPISWFATPFVSGFNTSLSSRNGWLRSGYWLSMIDSDKKGSCLKWRSCVCKAKRRSCFFSA
jgi:hypothetical protein